MTAGCRSAVVLVAVVLGGLVAATSASAAPLSVSTTPSLFPSWGPGITDYVIRCTGTPVQVDVNSPKSTTVSVDGQAAKSGSFTANVGVTTGQEFTIVSDHSGTTNTRYVRCLPTDFPNFTATVSGTRQTPFYLTAPLAPTAFGTNPPTTNYVTMFNNHGVPVWWKATSSVPVFATYLRNHDLAWTARGANAVESNLDGQTVHSITSPDGPIDFHELTQTGNGDFLVAVDGSKCCFDLSSWGGPASASVYDHTIEEINSSNQVVWKWDTADHINPVTATDPQWRASILAGTSPYDVFHLNSLAWNHGDVIVSYRHLNAVYDIHKANGSLVWKLGGSHEPESLTVNNDPVFTGGGDFCGQHDARIYSVDGTLTLHDNGTNCGRAPRAVRYKIDTSANTATLVESQTDSLATSSDCCGSARKLVHGDWVAAWGHKSFFTEMTSTGTRVFLLQYTDSGYFSYRVVPVLGNAFTISGLRAGMDAQYPRS